MIKWWHVVINRFNHSQWHVWTPCGCYYTPNRHMRITIRSQFEHYWFLTFMKISRFRITYLKTLFFKFFDTKIMSWPPLNHTFLNSCEHLLTPQTLFTHMSNQNFWSFTTPRHTRDHSESISHSAASTPCVKQSPSCCACVFRGPQALPRLGQDHNTENADDG